MERIQPSLTITDSNLGRFPEHLLKRVDKPTNLITDDIARIDARETAFSRAARGDYGPVIQKAQARPKREPLVAAQVEIVRHLAAIKPNPVAASRAPLPEDPKVISRHIKRLGYYLRADIMGIGPLPQSAIYSLDLAGNPINVDLSFAIVIVVAKEHETVEASSGHDWIVDSISFQAYEPAALIAQTMANYIRRLGYQALPQHTSRYDVMMPPLLLQAGLGEVSRAGIILNPFLGLCFKAAAVLTDLPLVADRPIDFGLQEYCSRCLICADECPVRAISRGPKLMYNGYETWKLDERRCASFFVGNKKGAGCGRCVKACPFTRKVNWRSTEDVIRLPQPKTKINKTDKEKWWFDLEEREGVLHIPSK
jgi:ferredoxin